MTLRWSGLDETATVDELIVALTAKYEIAREQASAILVKKGETIVWKLVRRLSRKYPERTEAILDVLVAIGTEKALDYVQAWRDDRFTQ